jgi:hypothetical protein
VRESPRGVAIRVEPLSAACDEHHRFTLACLEVLESHRRLAAPSHATAESTHVGPHRTSAVRRHQRLQRAQSRTFGSLLHPTVAVGLKPFGDQMGPSRERSLMVSLTGAW